ncbi:CBS domain-containing protein, partial [Acidianus sp. RZ1]
SRLYNNLNTQGRFLNYNDRIILMKVEDVMNTIITAVKSESNLREVVISLANTPCGRVLVFSEEKPEGIITSRDILAAFSEYGNDAFSLRAKDIYGGEIVSANPKDEVRVAVRKMIYEGIGGLPVMEGDKIVGMFTERDVVKILAKVKSLSMVDSVMTLNPLGIDIGLDLREAARIMYISKIRRLLVKDEEKVVGLITAADIIKGLARGITEVEKIVTRNPITVTRNCKINKAAEIMTKKRIGSLVVEEKGIVGILTERDLLYAYLTESMLQ